MELPPGQGYTYWLSQTDGALDMVATNLTQQTAYAYRGGLQTTGFGPDLSEAPGAAGKVQVTADGVALDSNFLQTMMNSSTSQGVLLFEGRIWSTAPLVLTVYDVHNNQVVQVSLQLSLGARILLLQHARTVRGRRNAPAGRWRTNSPAEPFLNYPQLTASRSNHSAGQRLPPSF